MKTKKNYAAWEIEQIDVETLDSDIDKLRYFSRYAILSPSGHNTQPWSFRFLNDYVEITVNKSQELPHSGKVAAEPFVSIGACIETLILAGKAYGYTLEDKVTYKPEFKVRISIIGKQNSEKELAKAIKNRVSNRELYKKKPLSKSVLDGLVQTSQPDITTLVIDGEDEIDYIANQTAKATIKIMKDPAFRHELSRWVRNNATNKYDGMPAFVQGMPLPPSLIAKHIIKNIDISKTQAKKDSERVSYSSALILLGLSSTTDSTFYQLGKEYARICIEAEKRGYSTSGVGASVIDRDIKLQIKQHYNMSSTPAALIRIGKATKKVKHSPRFNLEMVTLTNN